MRSCLDTEPTNDLRNKEMGNCIDEEFDISDSEFKEYKDAVHKLLKFRNYRVRALNGEFLCPFCVGEEKQGYYRLLEHAVRIAEGSTGSGKQRANHSAMSKYLVIDLPSEEKTIHGVKDETHRNAFEEARSFLCIAKDQSKRVWEQVEMFSFEHEKQWFDSREEELNKPLTKEDKRKMDELMGEIHGCDLKNNLAEEREAENELMKALEHMPRHCRVKFGVRKRGEIDEKSIMDACKKRHLLNEIEIKAFELCCFWVKKWRDSKRLLTEKNVLERCIKDYWGCKIYHAVLEYITNGNGMELWNFEEDKKASHCEVVRYVCTQWKTLQCERDELTEAFHSTSMSYSEEDESDEESSEDEGCPDPKAYKWNFKKVREAENGLVKPKPPPSAFILFMENFLKIYKQIDPTFKSIDVVGKAGGDVWTSMSQAEKAPYQAIAEKRKQEYEKLMIAYNKKRDSSSDEGSEGSFDSDLEEDDTCSSEA